MTDPSVQYSRIHSRLRVVALIGALVFLLPFFAFSGCSAMLLTAEATLHWDGSIMRDWVAFRGEQRLEDAVNRALNNDKVPFGQSVLLSDVVNQPMRWACVEGTSAPSHVWRDGPTRKLMKQSYRPLRRPPFDDYHDTILAVEFADGRMLGLLVPFTRHRVDFGTSDRYVCAGDGRISFTRVAPFEIRIRGD